MSTLLCFFLSLLLFTFSDFVSGQNISSVKANTDIGPCTCDLTGSACDANCCCDTTDCSAVDRTAFYKCTDRYVFPEHMSCYPKTLVFKANTNTKVAQSSSNLFCLERDNFKSRNYYTVPNTMTTLTQINSAYSAYVSYGFSSPGSTIYSFPSTYKAGNVILIMYASNVWGKLGIPSDVYSGVCSEGNLVGYLNDTRTKCGREITNLQSLCTEGTYLSAQLYTQDFKVAKSPSIYTSKISVPANGTFVSIYENSTELLALQVTAVCLDEDGVSSTCPENQTSAVPDVPAPVYDSDTKSCNYTLKKILYRITYLGNSGIQSVNVTVTLQSVSESVAAAGPVMQSFEVKFRASDKSDTPYPRSGNPGYLVGYPLLAGSKTTSGSSVTVKRFLEGLTLPGAGVCKIDDTTRTPVKFQIGQRLTCLKLFKSDISGNCALLQAEILQVLRSTNPANVVGTFGNSQPNTPGDWIPVLEETCDGKPTSQTYSCSNIVTGQNIQVIYAKVGALVNPQPKVIGVRRKCVTGDISYQCVASSCNPNSTESQTAEIVTAVSFIDASKEGAPVYKAKPIFLARLPRDFFYPFWVENGAESVSRINSSLLIFMTIVCTGIVSLWL